MAYAGRDPATGRKRYVSRTVHGGKRDAQRAPTAHVTEIENDTLVRTSAPVGELLERWFEHARGDFSPTTVLSTRGVLDRTLITAFGSTPLAKLRPDAIDTFYRGLRDGGHGREQRSRVQRLS
jgi:integrase